MTRTRTNCPRLIRLANLGGRYETMVRTPGYGGYPGKLRYYIAQTAVGAIAEAMIAHPTLAGISDFTEGES